MTDNSKVTLGNDRALFMFSRGYCYFPKCPVKVFRNVNGNARVQVERAHIIAEERNGPRWQPLNPKVVNSANNLMLMCPAHHKEIDHNVSEYPVTLLLDWKAEREGDLTMALGGLGELGEDGFERVITTAVTSAKDELITQLEKSHDLTEEVREALRALIDDRYDNPGISRDDIYILADATHQLAGMGLMESSTDLQRGASQLADLQGLLNQFVSAASEDRMSEWRFHFEQISQKVSGLPDINIPDVGPLEHAAARLERARDDLVSEAVSTAQQSLHNVIDQGRWKDYMLYGFVGGIISTLAVAGGIWYLVANGVG